MIIYQVYDWGLKAYFLGLNFKIGQSYSLGLAIDSTSLEMKHLQMEP